MIKPQYVLMISSSYKGFTEERMIFGPFNSIEDIKKWLEDKYKNSRYTIDIHPLNYPYD